MKNDGISVVISTYDDPIIFLGQCLGSLLHQEEIYEIIIVDSSKKDDIKIFCGSLKNDNIKYIYTPPKGLSDARNKGIEISKKDIVAFTDSDCITDKDWAKNIENSFRDNVAIVGGKILPKWITNHNKILCGSTIAQGFYSLFNMGDELKEVEQVFGGNFAINKNLIKHQFLTELGRKKENLLGGEESRLCQQVLERNLKIIYNPLAIVWHQIPKERSFRWVWRRMYYGGINRATIGGKMTPNVVNASYNLYDILFLSLFTISYIYGYIYGYLLWHIKRINNINVR